MKRLEDFTREDLAKFRKEIVLNSVFVADYRNSFDITANSAYNFFDGYLSFIEELADEDGFDFSFDISSDDAFKQEGLIWKDFFKKYDTLDNLENWHGCYDDFSWVEYEYEEDEEYFAA